MLPMVLLPISFVGACVAYTSTRRFARGRSNHRRRHDAPLFFHTHAPRERESDGERRAEGPRGGGHAVATVQPPAVSAAQARSMYSRLLQMVKRTKVHGRSADLRPVQDANPGRSQRADTAETVRGKESGSAHHSPVA